MLLIPALGTLWQEDCEVPGQPGLGSETLFLKAWERGCISKQGMRNSVEEVLGSDKDMEGHQGVVSIEGAV